VKTFSSIACILLLSLGLINSSQAGGKYIIGYVVDASGNIVHDNYGDCVRTNQWAPEHAIPACEGGIADADSDGVTDDKDKCPDTPANVKVDVKGCPLDSDRDGVADYLDKCPGTPAGAPVNSDGCVKDSDGDGIADYLDKCPGTANGVKVDNKGCKLNTRIELKGVTFANASAKLTAESSAILDEMVSILKRYPNQKVEVAGHTDSSGSRSYNVGLSQQRAESVRSYLIEKGISSGNLTAHGYGPDKPVADNNTSAGRASNRRVELRLK